jgi:hypothetical protein
MAAGGKKRGAVRYLPRFIGTVLPRSMKGHIAAQIALSAAREDERVRAYGPDAASPLYKELAGMNCWDAAIACQVKAGRKRPARVATDSHNHVISLEDSPVTNKLDMASLPEGASIGFFRDGTLVHFMLATGGGYAAGTKNACVGVGNPDGWENLDLVEELAWGEGGFTHRTEDGAERTILMRYRPIGDSRTEQGEESESS